MNQESKIVLEIGDLYAFKVSPKKLEIRLNKGHYAIVLGQTTSLEQAERFMRRANLYPHNL